GRGRSRGGPGAESEPRSTFTAASHLDCGRMAKAPAPASPDRNRPHGVADPRAYALAALGVALLLGAALLVVVLGPHRIGDYFTESDFYGSYAEGARLLQHGKLDPARYGVVGPVYEATLALVGLGIRDLFLAAQLISVAATIATLLLWYL